MLDRDEDYKGNHSSKSISDKREPDEKERRVEEGQASVQSLFFMAHMSDDTPTAIIIPKFVPDKQNCCSARKRITDGGL